MNAKAILMFAIATLFLATFVSAVSLADFTIKAPTNVSHNAGTFTMTFDVNNSLTAGSVDLALSGQTGAYTIAFSEDPVIADDGENTTITATVTFSSGQSGTFAGTITQDPSGNALDKTATFSVAILSESKLVLSSTQTLTKSQNGTIKVENTGNSAFSNVNFTASGPVPIIFSSNSFPLSAGSSSTVSVSPGSLSDLVFGTNTISITAKDITTGTTSGTTSFSIDETFCELGIQGANLSLRVDVKNDGEGDDDEWRYLDKITVDVDVEYEGNSEDEVRDVNLEIGLFDENGKNIANKLDYLSSDNEDRVDIGNMDTDSDTENVKYEFVVPADLDSGNYKLAIKAYGRDIGESFECIDKASDFNNDFFQTIKVKKESENDKQITFAEIKINPSDLVCGDSVQINARAFHVGDQDQDQVLIILKNTELNLDSKREIRNFDQGDDADISFNFIIPQNAQEKTYTLELDARYDYRERSDTYGESLESTYKFPLRVIGGCVAGSNIVTTAGLAGITASLISEAKANSELAVKVTISNSEATAKTFVIDTKGFDSWATFGSISERLVTLGPQQSADLTIKLNVKPEVSGQQFFTVTTQAGDNISTKQVAVNIAESKSFTSGNGWLWAVGLINLILIILIIIVAVRLASR